MVLTLLGVKKNRDRKEIKGKNINNRTLRPGRKKSPNCRRGSQWSWTFGFHKARRKTTLHIERGNTRKIKNKLRVPW